MAGKGKKRGKVFPFPFQTVFMKAVFPAFSYDPLGVFHVFRVSDSLRDITVKLGQNLVHG